ncbi:hypothetical protein [Neorhizobium galegae]|nr:hypothetical protein [Neorhizobium galegae]MCQ1837438.1 hypothetical protein [Neorhizobium galegae]UIY29242.1 hypothetical protein LZK73_22230 [Neorhizobium galegae]
MMIGRVVAAGFLAFGLSGHGAAAMTGDQFKLMYTLAIDGADSAHGEVTCEIGVRCEVDIGTAKFNLTVSSDTDRPHTLGIDCRSIPCSFWTQRSFAEFRKEAMPIGFHIYDDEDRGTFMHLVLKPRHIVGWLMLT